MYVLKIKILKKSIEYDGLAKRFLGIVLETPILHDVDGTMRALNNNTHVFGRNVGGFMGRGREVGKGKSLGKKIENIFYVLYFRRRSRKRSCAP